MKYKKMLVLFIGAIASAHATFANTKTIRVSNARVMAPLKGSNVTAAYATITNESDREIKINISSAKPFKAVELHESFEKEGKADMRQIDHLLIEPHKTAELKPGGNHIMLYDPTREVKPGDKISVELNVDQRPVEFTFDVVSRETEVKKK
jgi:copper(I)-binding protein